MRVIGTAGHVDHGKSTLVKALTGIDPDRLREEQKRQMTIELGFAWYESRAAGSIGIVDVPGHRDFIENMLAGVGGIDAVLLVIAADEGIMPQTKEHLSIIKLLHINAGLVVLTKVDLVEDTDWLDLVEMDVQECLQGSQLENAPILRVSALRGDGLQELKDAIDGLLLPLGPRWDAGRPRLPVDRVFSMTGFGTVVTGTLLDGSFRVDDEVEILPERIAGRIRGLQSHKKRETIALPGSRTAMNIASVDVAEVKRGDVIAAPGMFKPTQRIDAKLEILPDAPTGMRHNDHVKVFVHTSEGIGRIRLLQKQELLPGESGWVQIEFEKEMVLDIGDRFIIRRMSPAQTIGGGSVVDAHPGSRYKLKDPGIIERLDIKTAPTADNQILTFVFEHPFTTKDDIFKILTADTVKSDDEIDLLVRQGKLVNLKTTQGEGGCYISREEWQKQTGKMLDLITQYHKQYPLRNGMPRDDLARKLRITISELGFCVTKWVEDHLIKENSDTISSTTFEIKYSTNQTRRLALFSSVIDKDPYNPPGVKETREILSDELYQSLLEQGTLIQLSAEVLVRKVEYDQMLAFVRSECARGVLLTLSQFRDHFSTNRRISQAFLEHLDRKGITVRDGEGRRLKG